MRGGGGDKRRAGVELQLAGQGQLMGGGEGGDKGRGG